MDTKDNKINRLLKMGRGQQGEGENYKPWNEISTFGSIGRCTRLNGVKINRIFHLLSDNQLRAFLIFEFSPKIIDIRESYPLLDLMEVIDDKEGLNMDKYIDDGTGKTIVLTTNFLLTIKEDDGSIVYKARAVKNCTELDKKLTIEKYQVESRYWSSLGIEWKIITEKELNRQVCRNIQWFRETLIDNADSIEDKVRLSEEPYSYLKFDTGIIIKDILKMFEKNFKLDKGMGLYLFRFLVGIRKISIDMTKSVDLSKRIKDSILFTEEV